MITFFVKISPNLSESGVQGTSIGQEAAKPAHKGELPRSGQGLFLPQPSESGPPSPPGVLGSPESAPAPGDVTKAHTCP